MADGTNIEWTEATWNPIAGCSLESPGCTNCYAMQMAARIVAMAEGSGQETHYAGTVKRVKGKAVWTGKITVAPDAIFLKPLSWRRPRMIFVNSMSDLFHPAVPDEVIDRVFAVMALAPHHTFQVLTKRAERMRDYVAARFGDGERWSPVAFDAWIRSPIRHPSHSRETLLVDHYALRECGRLMVPLPNVWLGVSSEDQERADERVPFLLDTPAAVRWVSAEPLLGPLDLFGSDMEGPLANGEPSLEQLDGPNGMHFVRYGASRLDWIVAGGESGPGARPMHPEWVRRIRDQCAAADVAFHFKQWGAWKNGSDFAPDAMSVALDGRVMEPTRKAMEEADRADRIRGATMMRLVGKKAAGRTLDGVTHDAFPEVPHG